MIRVERSQPAPPSLAKGKKYNAKDVRERLAQDFHQKCAWCEGPAPLFEVDHLRPQKHFPEQIHVWENLLPACNRSCNQRREKDWPEGGLLDCCADDVEGRLHQHFATDPAAPDKLVMAFAARSSEDPQAANTAKLLTRLFDNGPIGTLLRRRLRCHWELLLENVLQLMNDGQEEPKRILARAAVYQMLGAAGPYSALLRARFDLQYPGVRARLDLL